MLSQSHSPPGREPRIAARLDVPPESTLVVIEEIVYTADDRPVEYSANYYKTSRCLFSFGPATGGFV
jgi:DNA-binding GntR family transcriptional regulator